MTRALDRLPLDGAAFAKRFGPWAVIAGASEGTGACFAEQLAAMGVNLVLVARRAEALSALAAKLSAEHGVECRTIVQDLTDDGGGGAIVGGTADVDVGLYISNAGADAFSRFFEDDPEGAHRLVRLNISTLIDAANGFGRRFLERGRGGLLIMASGAGLGGQPNLAMYAATKAFEIVFAESLWAEYHARGIDVMAVAAPMMATPMLLRTVPEGFDTSIAYDPADVTHNALAGLLAGEPVQIVPDGPLQEKIPQQLADRKTRLTAFVDFMKTLIGG